MNIFYFSSSTFPSRKANSIQVMRVCDSLAELSHKVILFSMSNGIKDYKGELLPDELKNYYGLKNKFPLYSLKSNSLRLLGGLEYGLRLYNLIKSLPEKADILYGRNLYGLIACIKLNKPIIYESHASPSLGRKQLERHLFSKPQFKLLAVISKALYNYYKENFEIFKREPKKLILLPDGAEIHNNCYVNPNVHKRPVLGYSGSLYPGKGLDLIISLASSLPEADFYISGGTDSQIAEAKKKCTPSNLFFLGFLPPAKTSGFLAGCDILLAPYQKKVYSENDEKRDLSQWMSPLKLFEYMSSKKPIIASKLPAIEEILKNEKTALLAEPNSICDWHHKISKLLCKPELCKLISDNAFSLLKENFTWEIRAKKLISALFETIGSGKTINTPAKKAVVLHVIGDLNVGGAELTMLKLLPELNKGKFEHKAITLFEPGALAEQFKKLNVQVFSLGISKNLLIPLNLVRILKLIKRIKLEKAVALQSWLYHSNNLINLLSFALKSIHIINNIRHNDPDKGNLKTRIAASIGSFIARAAKAKTVYCSISALENHINRGYPENEARVITNGFSIPKTNKLEAKFWLKQQFNIKDDHKIAVIAGRYCEEKDYPNLCKAIGIVLKKNRKITLLFCGKGLEKENKDFLHLITRHCLLENSRLLGNQKEPLKIMAGADFLVSSSCSESFPNVIAEAMSVGTPCIATDTGESRNIIGNTGLLVAKKQPNELAKAIEKFIYHNDKFLLSLGRRAKSRIEKNYKLSDTIKKYEALYLTATAHNDSFKQRK